MALASYPRCPICARLCEIEVCVVDQWGRAVHKSCCHKVTATVLTRSNYDEVEELLQQAQELREIANLLIERSDALIATYKQLTERDKLPRAG
jgi:hypothetical protein